MTVRDGLVTLDRLSRFASSAANRDALSDHGLMLSSELARWEHWCTPHNALTFASTGGDGVHFSLVDLGDGPSEASPVVMTVPMAFGDDLRPNWIVGETLSELLSLGLDVGYLTLEQLAYDPSWPVHIEHARRGDRPPILQRLADELGLAPGGDVADRLAELHQRYAPMLQIPPPI